MEMEVVSQDGYLLTMNWVPDEIRKGAMMRSDAGESVIVVYVERDENLIGVLPLDQL